MPADLRVAGDDRLRRFRQPIFQAAPIRRQATITVSGRRHGPCASPTHAQVLDARGYEAVTEAQDWPKVEVKGFLMTRPGVLER